MHYCERKQPIIIANRASREIAAQVAPLLGLKLTEMDIREFADGEIYHAFPCSLSGHDLILIAATPDDSSYQELLDLIAGARCWNALSVNVVIPYLGYSTMERAKPESGEIPKGITRARQLFRARPDYVAFIDLHDEAVMHTHSGEVRIRHLWTERLAAEEIRKVCCGTSGTNESMVLVSPDYGFSKRVGRLASLLDCPHTAANKDRYGQDKTIVGQLSSVLQGRTAIICDDMIRTGGSMLQTVDRCLEAGAAEVLVMATHLVLAGGARQAFIAKGIRRILGANTYPGRESDDLLQVFSVAPLIAGELKNYLGLEPNTA